MSLFNLSKIQKVKPSFLNLAKLEINNNPLLTNDNNDTKVKYKISFRLKVQMRAILIMNKEDILIYTNLI